MVDGFDPVEIIEGDYGCGLILVCDHAYNRIPPAYGDLGLPESAFARHIGYDIGAHDVTVELARLTGAPAVMATFSRLLVDPNRGEDDPTVVMRLSDGTIIPGNNPMSVDEVERRLANYHRPYHRAVDAAIDAALERGVAPALFAVHSFTPIWRGIARPWEVGLLWDSDPRLIEPMLAALRAEGDLTVGDNEPYNGALRNDTMYRHGTARGLAHCLIELRQDLIDTPDKAVGWARRLAPMLEAALALEGVCEIRHFGSRTGPVEQHPNPAPAVRNAG